MDKKFIRILDTNVNRCKEALRVIEDTARFIFEDDQTYKKIRLMRHSATQYLSGYYKTMLSARDSIKDCGRKVCEQPRINLENIITANFKRAEEALRVLEEYSKIINFDTALKFKALRYKVYAIEKKTVLKYFKK